MFVDESEIAVKAGDGGNGMVAFRREKFVPHGGPSGGDAGRGGSVILQADSQLKTLLDFRYKHNYKADRGKDGGPNCMTGADASDLLIKVPLGTQVYDAESGDLIVDLVTDGQKAIVAQGGRGGRGNARFATATRRTPRYSENGEPGEERHLRLELKLIADVGIIGFPNAGKSTLIAQASAARPKIADYPFTTLVPNLGVVRVDENRTFVMADIPGLIEGAHSGAGLGTQFLRHVERTRMLVHLLDCSGFTGRDPMQDFDVINRELVLYGPALAELPQVVALNKIDVSEARAEAKKLSPLFESRGLRTFAISAATGEGVRPLIYYLAEELERMRDAEPEVAHEEKVVITPPQKPDLRSWKARQVSENEFVVEGKGLERAVAMTDMDNEEAVRRFQRRLERMGVYAALKEFGISDGDTVRIGAIEFDYIAEDDLE